MDFDQIWANSILLARDKLKSSPSRVPITGGTGSGKQVGTADHSGRDAQRPVSISIEGRPLPIKGPAVGLFADQEIRLIARAAVRRRGAMELEREVVAISASRRTESLWVRSSVFAPANRAARWRRCCSISPASRNCCPAMPRSTRACTGDSERKPGLSENEIRDQPRGLFSSPQ